MFTITLYKMYLIEGENLCLRDFNSCRDLFCISLDTTQSKLEEKSRVSGNNERKTLLFP